MNINPARILPLPRWVANQARDAVGAKMIVTFRGQAGELPKLNWMATNHENPSTNSDCGVPLAAGTGQGRLIPPVGAFVLSHSKTGAGKLAHWSAYVLRRTKAVRFQFAGQVLQNLAAHSSLLRFGYPARWLACRQTIGRFDRAWTVCRVGYFFSFVEAVKQSSCRLARTFRLSLPRPSAEILDVYDVAYGDVPFVCSSLVRNQIRIGGAQGVGNFRQEIGEFTQGGRSNG